MLAHMAWLPPSRLISSWYFVFLADFSEQLLALFNISLPRWILLVILALINWPTIQMEKIQMLRFLSVASTACLGFVSLIVFTKFCLRGDRDMDLDAEAPERIALLPSSTENMAKALSIMLFANVNQMVSVPIVAELQNPTPSRIMKFTLVSATICFVFYVVTAFSVALTFGTATQGDFLKNYPVHDVVMIICRFLLLMMLMVCIPLNFFPMLQSFGRLRNDSLERKSTRRNWSTILLVVITAISMTISNVADFVSLVSSFLGSYFALLMPALVWMKSRNVAKPLPMLVSYVGPVLLILAGAFLVSQEIISVFWTCETIGKSTYQSPHTRVYVR
eukprot:GEMP01024891.1.p1 GENE.GEMP01024891.1~~GEMP01024891.1.p1  ORF type:complete len:334 (+),score=48.23 GEMP01024891.1:409-1410(+)